MPEFALGALHRAGAVVFAFLLLSQRTCPIFTFSERLMVLVLCAGPLCGPGLSDQRGWRVEVLATMISGSLQCLSCVLCSRENLERHADGAGGHQ